MTNVCIRLLRAPTIAVPVVLLAVALPGTAARADTVQIEPLQDSSIYSHGGDLSNGAGQGLFAGRTLRGQLRRSLIVFDIQRAVPAGSTITGVTLGMTVTRSRALSSPVSLYRVSTSWGEGNAAAPGQGGQGGTSGVGAATWTHRQSGSLQWTRPGGDFLAMSRGTAGTGGPGSYSWAGTLMTSDVQEWLDDPGSNFGWLLQGNEDEPRTTVRFASSEHPVRPLRPVLSITFTPPGPAGACCHADGRCTVALDPGGDCSASYLGTGTQCADQPCPQPPGACCLPDTRGTCTDTGELACATMGGSFQGQLTTCDTLDCPLVLSPFADTLPIPRTATPESGEVGGEAFYTLAVRQIMHRFHRDLPLSPVWAYDDGSSANVPGPTILARSGVPVRVSWSNDLVDDSGMPLETHILPVDECVFGAESQEPRIVTHLHGGHVPPQFDGSPENALLPGESAVYEYKNEQAAATLLYYDNAQGIARLNTYAGLTGTYIIDDDEEEALGLPSGEYDIPLILYDRTFRSDGSLKYPDKWTEHFFGDVTIVNGKVWPFLRVKRGKYRFRVINAANARTYRLFLSSGNTFQLIASDGGLLPAPITLSTITLAPGERAEIIVDFERVVEGQQVRLLNSAPAPFPGTPGVGVIPDVLLFTLGDEPGHTDPIPSELRDMERLDRADVTEEREFVLANETDPCTGRRWLVNGAGWNQISTFPPLGQVEMWRFVNESGTTHPIHIGLSFFQILDRQGFELRGEEIIPSGDPVPALPAETGWKDTVQVGPREIVRILTRFEDYLGEYTYYCNSLEHRDHEMNRRFRTTTECGDGARGLPDEQCDDGNTTAGDGCDPECRLEATGPGIPDAGMMVDTGTMGGGGGGGCGCRVGTSAAGGAEQLLWGLLVAAWRGRRRRG